MMFWDKEIKNTRRALTMGILLFIIEAAYSSPCPPCGISSRLVEEDPDLYDLMPAKRDIFMSRGWGAGGGPTANMDLSKKTRVVEMLMNEDDLEANPQPRTAFLRFPSHSQKADIPRRRHPAYIPQLFISSGWGPLGK